MKPSRPVFLSRFDAREKAWLAILLLGVGAWLLAIGLLVLKLVA